MRIVPLLAVAATLTLGAGTASADPSTSPPATEAPARPTTIPAYKRALWEQEARVWDASGPERAREEAKLRLLRTWWSEDTIVHSEPMIVTGALMMAAGLACTVGAIVMIATQPEDPGAAGARGAGYALLPAGLAIGGGGAALAVVGASTDMKSSAPHPEKTWVLALKGTF